VRRIILAIVGLSLLVGCERKPVRLATTARPTHLVLASSTLYWIADGRGIERVSVDGDGHERIVEGNEMDALAVDAEALYFGDCLPDHSCSLQKLVLATRARSTLYAGNAVDDIALGGDYVYFGAGDSIFRQRRGGGVAEPVGINARDSARGLAADATHVYFQIGGHVHRLGVTQHYGEDVVVAGIAGKTSDIGSFVIDDRYIYWSNDWWSPDFGPGEVLVGRTPKEGGEAVPILRVKGTKRVHAPSLHAVDFERLYFRYGVYFMPKDGSGSPIVYWTKDYGYDNVVDERGIYFTQSDGIARFDR